MDALRSLMNLQSPSNFAQTAGSYTPNISRNVPRVAALRKFFGMEGEDVGDISQQDYETAYGDVMDETMAQQQAEAQARAYPYQVQGQYRVQAEREKARAAAEARAMQADLQRQLQQERQAFQAQQGQLNREAVASRMGSTQESIAARQQRTQQEMAQRQQNAVNARRAAAIRDGKEEAPGASFPYGFLGFGTSQDDANQALLSTLEPSALEDDGSSDIEDAALDYVQFANLGDEDLLSKIAQTQPDATPDEMLALRDAIRRLR